MFAPLESIRRFSYQGSRAAACVGPRPGCVRLPRAPCCVRLAKKYALCWLRCALAPFLRSNLAVGPRFCSLGRSPGPDLPCLNDRFAASHAARARVTPTSSNSVKTPLKLSRNACRPVCAKRRSRRKNVASALRDACCATAAYDFRVSASPPPSGVFPEAPRRRCWRRSGRPRRAHRATRARHGMPSERPQSVPERLATAFACPTGRPEAFWSAWASILARLGRSAWSPGTPFAFDFRTSWHCALRLAFARATAFDQQNAKKKRGAFAFVLRLAARARPCDFHDFSHDLRGHVLFVAPR